MVRSCEELVIIVVLFLYYYITSVCEYSKVENNPL